MDSFSAPPSRDSSQINPQAIKEHLQNELAKEFTKQLLETVREKCFLKCIPKPSSSLSGNEQSCVSKCFDRYMEATGIVTKALFSGKH
ncbi:mitochondrial import inner membrane translocase subunit Tim13 [Trifolium pratense]|uniref:Uncharacterized protein n=1 Tax=Trifolium pratense TaxID=57577 RepID=A0ACB0LIP1_TRIPR|nr:mitochondrial import inner membrane translocase subunit Tim13 [Trifolium pratense]CAJ2668513.1 unnamed protein product [Trifolium pratense]